jgi:hypothetical protein
MDERIATLQQTAASVIEQLGPLSGIEFGFNRESVEWVTEFIERQRARPDLDNDMISGLTGAVGSFLGESLIAATGARWEWSDEFQQWSINLGGNNTAYPFAKVRKQLESGLEGGESIISFYDIILKHVVTGNLSRGLNKNS